MSQNFQKFVYKKVNLYKIEIEKQKKSLSVL